VILFFTVLMLPLCANKRVHYCYYYCCLTAGNRSLEALHRKELDKNKLLRQQLSTAQSAARQLSDAKKQAALLQKKVNELQNVQAVINGTHI